MSEFIRIQVTPRWIKNDEIVKNTGEIDWYIQRDE
jgi:hypothetical protein